MFRSFKDFSVWSFRVGGSGLRVGNAGLVTFYSRFGLPRETTPTPPWKGGALYQHPTPAPQPQNESELHGTPYFCSDFSNSLK